MDDDNTSQYTLDQVNWNYMEEGADILKRAYLCQVSDTGSPEPLVLE
jgi:hypothetical protein